MLFESYTALRAQRASSAPAALCPQCACSCNRQAAVIYILGGFKRRGAALGPRMTCWLIWRRSAFGAVFSVAEVQTLVVARAIETYQGSAECASASVQVATGAPPTDRARQVGLLWTAGQTLPTWLLPRQRAACLPMERSDAISGLDAQVVASCPPC